jgi:hypothetical protein
MQRKTRRIIMAVALVAALAAGGAAFTTGTALPDSTAVYGTVTVTGATVSSISNNLSSDGTYISSVDLVFSAPVAAGDTVKGGFSDATPSGGAAGDLETCTTADLSTNQIHYSCPAADTGTNAISGHESTAHADHFAVAVSH